jgi:sphingomyelin phosphodiesterase acid-like 3
MMSKFATCEADNKDRKGSQEQIAWLTKELDGARERGERVWVLGHIPPEIDLKGSLAKGFGICGSGGPVAYLASDELAAALTSHADIVRLALFGHTHLDELHLLGSKEAGVPMKVVASISNVDGNTPSFTVGKVAPASATLVDYTVYEASNATGVGTTWAREYGFDETYHETSFSPKALSDVIGRFRADGAGDSAESKAYQTHFFKGHAPMELGPLWEGYVCSLDHPTADGYKACICGGL